MRPPIVIPESLQRDRTVKVLLTQWRNLHLRHTQCQQRVYWARAVAAKVEKARRKERWILIARILEIEHTLLLWLARATHHPDLYTPKALHAPESRRATLLRRYHTNRTMARNWSGQQTVKRTAAKRRRSQIVAAIRALEREWLLALYTTVHPQQVIPAPLALHPTELRPRKITAAIRLLTQEVA